MVNVTRSLGVLVVSALVTGIGLSAAPVASATSHSIAATCGSPEVTTTITPGIASGDTVTITYPTSGTDVCGLIGINYVNGVAGTRGLVPVSGISNTPITGTDYVYTLDGSGTAVLTAATTQPLGAFWVDLGRAAGGLSPNDGYMVLQGALPEAPVSVSGPADIIQQTGVPASGDCASVVDAEFAYGTKARGGWGKSWARWINAGAGGAVCTRTLTYNHSLAAWVIAS